jgi:hypothetical protein
MTPQEDCFNARSRRVDAEAHAQAKSGQMSISVSVLAVRESGYE